MPLAKKYPDLKIVIQDLPNVVREGKKFWSTDYPQALGSGTVRFEEHNFFEPQPIKNASVFIVKQILHNWPNTHISKLLCQLREAATKDTVLIIIDNVLPYACRLPENADNIDLQQAPEPLLPNYGAVGNSTYTLDMTMTYYFNAGELTIRQAKDLLASSG